MHWLEGTFANRFNRLRDERGHVFQTRYKSLAVEDSNASTACARAGPSAPLISRRVR
jgi:hypothetical protein